MTKVKYQMKPPSQTQHIGSPDTTFAGSRNGFSPLVLWDHLARHSYKDQVKRIKEAQELTDYLEQQLRTLEKEGAWCCGPRAPRAPSPSASAGPATRRWPSGRSPR
ncbi:hypothetical protein [Kitasatospora sp. NPDC087315]|uniref:hypothetical protein n=1 Tax=Kitasatospora sp. NPDC087315 TaxID=3364069 RepID=UPI00381CFAA5